MVLDFSNMDVDKEIKPGKLITIQETDDSLYFWETDSEGSFISEKTYRKLKPSKPYAEDLVEGLK